MSENALAYVVRDGFPVVEGHSLVIPKRHTLDYFGLSSDEVIAVNELIAQQRRVLLDLDSKIEGFNICLLYTSPSPRDRQKSRMPSSA